MAAIQSDNFLNATGVGSGYGWIQFSCGCSYRDWEHPNKSTSVGGYCPICRERKKDEKKTNPAAR